MTNGVGGFIHGHGMDDKERLILFLFNARMSEESHRVYAERHVDNPWSAYMKYVPVGTFVQSNDIMPLAELERTAFFDEVLRPQDVAHNFMIPFAERRDFQVGLNMFRSAPQGPFEEEALRLFSQLYPHLRRSLLLGFRLNGYKALQRAEFHVLDRLSVGVILLDRSAKVVFANVAARSVSSDDGPLRLRKSIVTAQSPPHAQQLGALIRAAQRGAPAGSMSVPRLSDGQLLTILVSSVRGRDIGRFADLSMRDAAVLLFIVDPANRAGIPIAWITDAYGLTRAEAKVALAASLGLTIPDAAVQLGVSPNTIKTHLRKVFAKTGTSRQTELARVMALLGLVRGNGSGPTET